MYNYMVAQIQFFKLQMQPKAVPVYDISLYKVTPQKIFVSADLYPDNDPVQAIDRVFIKYYNIDPHTSGLRTQTRFATPLSCDIKPDINKPTPQNIVSQLIWILILILSRKSLEFSANFTTITLTHHAFKFIRGLSQPSVVILNLLIFGALTICVRVLIGRFAEDSSDCLDRIKIRIQIR